MGFVSIRRDSSQQCEIGNPDYVYWCLYTTTERKQPAEVTSLHKSLEGTPYYAYTGCLSRCITRISIIEYEMATYYICDMRPPSERVLRLNTVPSRYSCHVYSGHSDKVATFPDTKYIYSVISRLDIVGN